MPASGKLTNGPPPADASRGDSDAGFVHPQGQPSFDASITVELSLEVWGRLEQMSLDLGRSITEIATELIERGVDL